MSVQDHVRRALEQSDRERDLTGQLEEERARLIAAQSVAKVGSWHTDLVTNVLTWSAETYRIFETTPAEFDQTYDAFLRHVHPDDRADVDQALSQSLLRNTPSTIEHRVLLPDGSVKFVEERWLVEHDDEHRPIRATGTCRDITEQKAAERRIQHLNRVYAVLSGIDHMIVREKDPTSMLTAACQIAVEKGLFKMAWIGLPAKDGELTIAAHAGATPETLAELTRVLAAAPAHRFSLARTALATARPQTSNDIATDSRVNEWRVAAIEQGFRSMASLPLITDGTAVGTFNLCSDQPLAFDDDEMRLLEGLASDIAFALDVHRRDAERRLTDAALRTSEARLLASLRDLHDVSTRLNEVREQERARIARDIHDHLGQALTALKMDVAEVRRRIRAGNAAAVDERLTEMAALIDASVEDVRRVAAELRPVMLDDLGLVVAMTAYVQDVGRRGGLTCVLHTDLCDLPIADDRATALFRILQEALTNVMRHARATRVDVTLTADATTVGMTVQDDGCGISASPARRLPGTGLVGMQDRARLFGGSVSVTGHEGTGTRVAVSIPRTGGTQ